MQKYLAHPNYGKAAKRMYNVFRYSGRYLEAAFVRELFDEPTTMLYQVWSLIWTLENAAQPGSTHPRGERAGPGRRAGDDRRPGAGRGAGGARPSRRCSGCARRSRPPTTEGDPEAVEREIEAAKAQLVNVVNKFFRDRLSAVPSIKDYMDTLGVVPRERRPLTVTSTARALYVHVLALDLGVHAHVVERPGHDGQRGVAERPCS